MLVIVSTLILILIGFGLAYRKRPVVHIPIMVAAFVADIGLVLYIEWSRHAVETFTTSVQDPVNNQLLLFHIVVSLLTILLYIALIVSGIKLFKGGRAALNLHRGLAAVFLICRLTNYVTSFWVA